MDLLKNKKALNDFRQTIKNTKNLIKKDTEYIAKIEDLNDNNKGEWINHDDENFKDIFDGLVEVPRVGSDADFAPKYSVVDHTYLDLSFRTFL